MAWAKAGTALGNLWRTRHQTSSTPEEICVTVYPKHNWFLLFVHRCKALTSRCSLQILHSHTARGRLPHCVPHLVHMFYATGENRDFQLLALYDVITDTQLRDRDLLYCLKRLCDAAEECVWLTFLQSSHTTELTPGEPSCSPHSKQRDIPSPHTVFFMSSSLFIKRLQQHRVRSYLKCHW